MSRSVEPLEIHLTAQRAITNAVRRRVWRWLFADDQGKLGSFFLDPRDHIGAERVITGDWYEGQLLALLGLVIDRLELGSGSVLDVGANIGNHACYFARRFRHVVCVEPGRAASLVLDANLDVSGLQNYEIHRVALGKEERSGVLDRISHDNLGSSVVRSVDGEGEFRITRGDRLLREAGIRDLKLIKIDVEGAEVEALEGLAGTLASEKPIVCVEVLDEQRWDQARTLLLAAGYGAWFVIVPDAEPRTAAGRLWTTLRGRRLRLTPIPKTFRENGYDMILCMTSAQASQLTM